MTVWAIKSEKGFLKGNGTASHLVWHKEPHKGNLYKTRKAADGAIKRLSKRRNPVKAEIFEIEMVLRGTFHDILEKEVLSEN